MSVSLVKRAPVITIIRHPHDCRLYSSDMLWTDANYAFTNAYEAGELHKNWRYHGEDEVAHLTLEIGTDLPTHPGEYVERTRTKALRGGGTAMVSGTRIYVRKRHPVYADYGVTMVMGAMECIGSIDYACGPDFNGLRVMTYSRDHGRTFDRADVIGAQRYALSQFL